MDKVAAADALWACYCARPEEAEQIVAKWTDTMRCYVSSACVQLADLCDSIRTDWPKEEPADGNPES